MFKENDTQKVAQLVDYMKAVPFDVSRYALYTARELYEGYDPEVDTSSKKNPMTPGIDYAAYPKSRTYVIGINVTF